MILSGHRDGVYCSHHETGKQSVKQENSQSHPLVQKNPCDGHMVQQKPGGARRAGGTAASMAETLG